MQLTFICILLASIAIISASDHGIRSKRDLSFIKSYILSKIFGSYRNDTTPLPPKPENYRLFRVPGFDNILVKAVPKVPVILETDAPPPSVLEITESAPVPVHPSIAIVSKYLGTNQLNDTLFALRGVKDLLKSGVLTAQREGIDNTAVYKDSLPSVLVESSQIHVDEARRPVIVYPSPEQVPRYPNLPIPLKYSYKQVNNDGEMSYTAHDNQNVMVTESRRPVHFPSPISYRIQDILSLGIQRLPTSPAMHMRVKSPEPFPVFEVPKSVPHQMVKVMPTYIPSGYSYNQVHSDGSVTTYSGSGYVEEHEGDTPVVITKAKPTMSVVVAEMEGRPDFLPVLNVPKVQVPNQPVKVPFPSSGYSYNQVHNDGSVTTYSGSGHVVGHNGEKSAVVITEPGRPTVVLSDVDVPSAPFHVLNASRVKMPSSSEYSYNQVHNDGSVTTYSGSGHVVEHEREKTAMVYSEPGRPTVVVSDEERPPAPYPVFKVPMVKMHSGSVYSYNLVHNDGSMTTHLGSKHHKGQQPAVVITEPGRPTVVVDDVEGPPSSFPAFNAPKAKAPSGSGYSYNQVHNDGSVTTYSGSGHVVEHEREKTAMVFTEPGRPTVVVADVDGPPASFPVINVPKVKIPFGSGYSYNHVHNDGSITAYSGSGHVADHEREKAAVVITEPRRPTLIVSDVEGPPAPFPVFNAPKAKAPSGSGYSYNHVHNDGSFTTYSGSGHVVEHEREKPAVVITEPGRPTVVVSDVAGPPAPFPVFNVPKVEVPSSSGYSYNHVHNDGSVYTYSGHSHERGKPSVLITEPGRPTVVVSDAEGPPAPFPVFNVPNAKVPSGSGYSYNHVRNDGSVITNSGSGHVLEHEGKKPAVVITEPGRPTVVVSNVEGPPAPFPVFDVPRMKAPSGSRYFYNHAQHDGSVTTYSRPGHEGEKPRVFVESGRPSVVVAEAEIPPGPFPTINVPEVKVPSDSGFSYNHVHKDGAVTTYLGSGHVVGHEGDKPGVIITEPGRPTVVVTNVEGPPAPFPVFNVPRVKAPSGSGYSYNHVHNDGSMTMYSGDVKGHKGDTSPVVVTEKKQPLPLPTFLTNRIENVAATSMAARPPTSFYRRPSSVFQEQPIVLEERPDYVYQEKTKRPNFGEHVEVFSGNHNDKSSGPTNVPSGFSYKTVHEDGSVTSYIYAGEAESAPAVPDRPILYPTAPAAPHVNDITGKEHSAETVICKDPAHVNKKVHSHTVAANSNSSKFSYTMVSEGGSSTKYFGSGHVEHNHVNNSAHVQASPIETNPTLLVTQTDDDNPEKVSLTPVLSQYMYKQVNHHKPNEFTVVKMGDVQVADGKIDMKASPGGSSKPELHSVKDSEVSKEIVFIPTSSTKEPVPSKKPVVRVPSSTKETIEAVPSSLRVPLAAVTSSTKIRHSKPKRVFRHRVRTSTSSSSKILKTSAPLTTTSKVSSTTVVTTSEGSLSANPIVVLPEENVLSFKQERTDGTSITVVGNKENKVSVVQEPKIKPSRGDIPDSTF